MNIELPVVPLGVTVLLVFLSPYAVAIINHPAWSANSKKLVTVAVTLILSGVALWLYYALTGDVPLPWPAFSLLFLVVSQAAYALLLKPSVKRVESAIGVKDKELEVVVIDPSELDDDLRSPADAHFQR